MDNKIKSIQFLQTYCHLVPPVLHDLINKIYINLWLWLWLLMQVLLAEDDWSTEVHIWHLFQ